MTPAQLQDRFAEFSRILEVYSQPFRSGQRQLDPDKLSKVMFLCGMSIGLAPSPPPNDAPDQNQGTNAQMQQSLEVIDQAFETIGLGADDQQLLQRVYS